MIRLILAICLLSLLACVAYAGQCGYPTPVYINGINTSPDVATKSLKKIQEELRKTNPEITIELAYNQTEGFTLDLVESLYQKADTYHLRTADASLYIYGVISGSDTGLRDAPSGFLNDIKTYFTSHVSELVAQFTQIKPVYNQTLSDITGILRNSLANSPGLYLITHSQGSLFANDALYLLDQNELSATSGKRTTTGTYFIAPAASAQLASYGTGYTKFNEDLLSELGIGMVGNTSFCLPQAMNKRSTTAWEAAGCTTACWMRISTPAVCNPSSAATSASPKNSMLTLKPSKRHAITLSLQPY